jgi:hypothetical protein
VTATDQNWVDLLQVSGAVVAIIGTLLMANRYTKERPWQVFIMFWLCFVPWSRAAEAAKTAADWSRENTLRSFRGLALIAFGFILQVIPGIVHLCGYKL